MLKNRLTYLLVLVVLALMIYLYEDSMTYTALFAMLVLPAFSLALAFAARRRFSAEEHLVRNNIIKGENTQYVFRVRNNSFLPCTSVRVRFKPGSPAVEAEFVDQYFSIRPFKSHEVVFNISAKYRGNFQVGVEGITMYDFLGLFRFHQKHGNTLTLTVCPQVLGINSLPLSDAEGGIDFTRKPMAQEDYSMISDLRKYQPTDGYKKIHWKISAKKNELISKNYQSTGHSSTAVLVDNSIVFGNDEAALSMEDFIMDGCASVLSYCVLHQQNTVLHYIDNDKNEGISGGFEHLYKAASEIQFGGLANDFDAYFSNFSKKQIDAENLIVLTKKITDQVLVSAQTLHTQGSNVIIIFFENPDTDTISKVNHLADIAIFCRHFEELLQT